MDLLSPIAPVFLTQREVADLLCVPVRTVEDWRLTGSGPPWVELGRHVRYEQSEQFAWVKERRHGRPRIRAGEVGEIQITKLAKGRIRARARARDDAGVLHQIVAVAATEEAARIDLRRTDVQWLPLPEKKTSILTPEQIAGIRELMQHWRVKPGNGPRPDYRALVDGMDIVLGTSARVGECIGLRRCDVDMTVSP